MGWRKKEVSKLLCRSLRTPERVACRWCNVIIWLFERSNPMCGDRWAGGVRIRYLVAGGQTSSCNRVTGIPVTMREDVSKLQTLPLENAISEWRCMDGLRRLRVCAFTDYPLYSTQISRSCFVIKTRFQCIYTCLHTQL